MDFLKKYPIAEISIHSLVLIAMYAALYFLGIFKVIPSLENISQWDTGWYSSIVKDGYSYIENAQCNIAFFPLFPYLWKFTQLSVIGMSILNYIFLCIGFTLLYRAFNLSTKELFILLSTPSLFFCYVPYSEALFFLSCSIFLYGIQKEMSFLCIVGLGLACLTRSVSILFIPGILFSWLLITTSKNKMSHIRIIVYLLATAIASTLLVNYIQYLETGVAFKLFEVQLQWGHIFSWPEFYLTTWDGVRLLWLDGLAFYTGIICLLYCIYYSYDYFINKKTSPIHASYLFSLFYLAASTLVVFFYSGKDGAGGTSIYSLNRYIFATPFFSVFIIFLLRKTEVTRTHWMVLILSSIVCWSFFGLFSQLNGLDYIFIPVIKTQQYFALMTAYAFLYLLMTSKKTTPVIWYGVYLINIALQLFLLNSFIQGKWIG